MDPRLCKWDRHVIIKLYQVVQIYVELNQRIVTNIVKNSSLEEPLKRKDNVYCIDQSILVIQVLIPTMIFTKFFQQSLMSTSRLFAIVFKILKRNL